MADHIDNFHNAERRHSYLGNISPIEYEKLWADIQPYPQLSSRWCTTGAHIMRVTSRGSCHSVASVRVMWTICCCITAAPRCVVFCLTIRGRSSMRGRWWRGGFCAEAWAMVIWRLSSSSRVGWWAMWGRG